MEPAAVSAGGENHNANISSEKEEETLVTVTVEGKEG